MRGATLQILVAATVAVAVLGLALGPSATAQHEPAAAAGGTCVTCHAGIEDMHPAALVTCVQCHGGDDTGQTKEQAHVARRTRPPGDERVLGQNFDPEFTRFRAPGNLRVAALSCGPCHERAVYDVTHSLHATTSGHLGDGLYENGVVRDRHPAVSVFSVTDDLPADLPRPPGAVAALKQIPGFSVGGDRSRTSTHFSDLPRKSCMQCHLWSEGRAVRGRAGMDGDYRGEGCSACHVPYADDGLSLSRDQTVSRYEPGHPREHRMVRFPPTEVCTRCHYGDASIGLSFRGLAQPVPGMPQTPDAPGLHRKLLNGMYYIDDPSTTPPDVHHQRGMHCVDCHTRDDVMGDGFLYRRMEDAVAIRCSTCHGTADSYATFETARGRKLPHLSWRDGSAFLQSRVTGKHHRMKQARDVVRPGSADYNSRAVFAMTADHDGLECYACHSGWNPNFFGFHFDRNEQFTQLDLLSGNRTTGRVSTQEKVFSTFKHFYLGWNSHGRIAPYMVGFSTMATVHDENGSIAVDQALPVTRAGLSGMTMIHHQTHTTTARARQCVECHRAPSTFGRGTVNFRLTRDFAVVATDRGVRMLSLDRRAPADSAMLSSLPVEQARAVALCRDRLTGHGTHVLAAAASGELVVGDLRTPGFPRVAERVDDAVADPQTLLVVDETLYVADGSAGLRVFEISDPMRPKQVAHLEGLQANGLFLDGTTLFVAAGPRGLTCLDVSVPAAPRVLLADFDLNGEDTAPIDATRVVVLFQYSRPSSEELEGARTGPLRLAAVASAQDGLYLLDVTEPSAPRSLSRMPRVGEPRVNIADLAMGTVYELGSEGGAIPSRERDYVVAVGRFPSSLLLCIDVTDPMTPRPGGFATIRDGTRAVSLARVYNPPFLQTLAVTAGPAGTEILDLTRPAKPLVIATLASGAGGYDVDMEEFPLDRTVDSAGRPIMDVSHEGARWLSQEEFLRVLGVPLPDALLPGAAAPEVK